MDSTKRTYASPEIIDLGTAAELTQQTNQTKGSGSLDLEANAPGFIYNVSTGNTAGVP